jgi:hypothetical protein
MKGELGDLLVKLDWHDRPIGLGLLVGREHGGASLRLLYPTGPAWEYSHDMFSLDDARIKWRVR